MSYDANGNAFQITETRTGVPLVYVAEKLYSSIIGIHATVCSLTEDIPDDFPLPERIPADAMFRELLSAKQDLFLSPAEAGLSFAVTAFIALYNMLNLPGITDLVENAHTMSSEDLKARLLMIQREGSLN